MRRIPLSYLEEALRDPVAYRQRLDQEINAEGLPRQTYFGALRDAIYRFHKSGDNLIEARRYLQRRLASFASIDRKLETVDQLEWYAENVSHRGWITFQNRLHVEVPLPQRVSSELYCSGEVSRIDMVPTGGYAVWLIRVRGANNVFTELCMPLIQDTVARITLNVLPSEIQVGVYSFTEQFVNTRSYTRQEIFNAHTELGNLLRRMGY